MSKRDNLRKVDVIPSGTIINAASGGGGGVSDNANTVDYFHAYTVPIANSIVALDSDARMPSLALPAEAARVDDLDLELMKMCFQSISWAQFAIFDNFHTDAKRADTDPSTYPAQIVNGVLTNNGDTTNDRAFGWVSKTYTNITTVLTGTSTGVGLNYLEDSAQSWFTDQYKSYQLVDSATTVFAITGCTTSPRRLTVAGTPAAGAYTVRATTPAYCVAFCTFLDSSNGGYGYTKLDVSFDGGVNYQTLLDTSASTNVLGGVVAVANTGRDYLFRLTLTNDGSGNGAEVQRLLICTDPSVWG